MLDARQRIECRGASDFVALAIEGLGLAEGHDLAAPQLVRPCEALRTRRWTVSGSTVCHTRVRDGNIRAARFLVKRSLRHFARDFLARQAITLHGFFAYTKETRFSRR